MKNLLLITDVNFWMEGAGHRMRILRLVEYLRTNTNLTIAYIGIDEGQSAQWLNETFRIDFIYLDPNRIIDNQSYNRLLSKLFEERNFDVSIIEFIHLSYCLKSIPNQVTTILDAHDIINERSAGFAEFNYPIWGYHINKELEYKLFGMYDYVMVICDVDYQKIQLISPTQKLILAPHPVKKVEHIYRSRVQNIGFIASEYTPNVDAIVHFLNNIWSHFSLKTRINLSIYGNVSNKLTNLNVEGLIIKGFVEDLEVVYNEVDIVINPVRFGAGLKIKNMEAIGHGIPLITTVHGARGLELGMGSAFIQVNTDEDFLEALYELVLDFEFRKKIGKNALEFAQNGFSAEICFKDLHKIIYQ